MTTPLTLSDVQFIYWLSEYDQLLMDGPLDHNLDVDLEPPLTQTELRDLFDAGYTPLEAAASLHSLYHGRLLDEQPDSALIEFGDRVRAYAELSPLRPAIDLVGETRRESEEPVLTADAFPCCHA